MASQQLRDYFAALAAENDLQRLIGEAVKEDLYLEFKTKKDRSRPDLDDSEKFHFSRALSGFANSDGGVLLWGIETKQHEQASKLKPITAVLDFRDRLKKSLLHSTQPVVDGVALEVIGSCAFHAS